MKVLIRKLVARLQRLPPLTITAIALGWVLAVGAADYTFPGPVSFVLFYLLAVVFAGWGAGKRPAWLVSGAAVLTMVAVQRLWHRGIPMPDWVSFWNNSTRLLIFSLAGWLVAEVTRLTRDLGRLVEERTAQWKAEAEQHQATSARWRETLERFEQVVNNIAEVFWLTDVTKDQMIFISPGYERIWGRTCEDLYREPKSWVAAVHPAEREEILRRAQTEQAAGRYDVEYRILRPDGAVRWIRDRAFPVRNEQGEIYRIAGIAEDITERKKSRETLQSQAAILENMAEGVVVTDEQGIIVQMNPAAERIWGYKRHEVLGQPASVFSALPEPEATAILREVLAALEATGAWRGTFQNRRKDGALISCEAVIGRLEIQGRVLMVAVEEDVTKRVRTQEQLQIQARVLESMAEAVVMVDDLGAIVLTNPALDALLGYERGELPGKPLLVVSGYSAEEHRRQFEASLEQVKARGSSTGEYLARRKDGTLIEVETRTSSVRIGDRFCLVIVGQDITERKQREEALRQSEQTLRVFLDAVPEPAFLLDRNGVILVSNEALAGRLGLPQGEPIGQYAFGLLPADIGKGRKAAFDQVVLSRQPVRFEDYRGGRHFLNFGSPVLDTAGNVTRVAWFALDITERKQAEAALARQETLYRTLFELSPDGILLEDAGGNILNVNQALCESSGYSREELLRQNVRCFAPAEDQFAVEAHLAALRGGQTLEHEVWNLRKDGERRLVRLNEKPLMLPDGRQAILVVARDVTDSKRVELTKEALLSLGAKLSEAKSPVEAARAIYAAAEQLWPWDSAALSVYSREADRVEPVLFCDVVEGQRRDVPAGFPAGSPTARMRRVMREGAELILRRPGEMQDTESIRFGDVSRLSASIMSVPLRWEGQPVGFLSIQSYTPDAYTQADLQTLQALADHCAGALERIRARVALQESHDALEQRVRERTVELQAANAALREARDRLEARVKERTAELETANAFLRQSEERYRSLVNNLNVGVYRNTPGPQGRFLHANPALVRMHGYDSLEEFQRVSVADLYQAPSERQVFLAELLRRGAVANHELRLKKKDGTPIYGSINATVHRGPDGAVDWIDGVLEDITERKQAQALLQAQRDLGISFSLTSDLNAALKHLLDVMMPMAGADAGGVYLLNESNGGMDAVEVRGLSAAFAQAVSHWAADSPQMQIMQKGKAFFGAYRDLPIPNDQVRLREGLQTIGFIPLRQNRRLIGGLVLSSHQAFEIPRQTQLVVEALASQAAGAIARIRAETDRSRLERQILEISDREQARLGQDIHDGLCQQLVSLAFDANSLQDDLVRQHRPEAAKAGRIAHYLDQAITETRLLSRGLFPIRLEAEGLVPALEELAKSTSERFQIVCRLASPQPVVVQNRVVATHLYRIAQEAVTNAVKHSRARKVSIRLRARAGQLELRVEDDGAGLSAAQPDKGAGLGLHIMDYRARSMGGTLRVAPGSRGGTAVSCCVPCPLT